LDVVKSWARSTKKGYNNFLQINISIFWIVNSIIDITLNFPESIYNDFVVDITRCYESILLQGAENLIDTITFVITIAYKQAVLKHF
jgi:hypothetical protein